MLYRLMLSMQSTIWLRGDSTVRSRDATIPMASKPYGKRWQA